MITWTLKQTQMVFFKTMDSMFAIYEYEVTDNTPHFYFQEAQSYPDPFPKIERLPRFFIPETESYKELPKAKDLFEAQANLVETLIEWCCQRRLNDWVNGKYPVQLMSELGSQNLPLLMNFFTEPNSIKAFSEVLKK
jgi:hypothetical protein